MIDVNNWEVHGEPTTKMRIDRPMTPELTCSVMMARVKQIIKAPSGYVTTSKMGTVSLV